MTFVLKKQKMTIKLLFLDFQRVDMELAANILDEKFAIFIVHEPGRKDPFLLDTGIEVNREGK